MNQIISNPRRDTIGQITGRYPVEVTQVTHDWAIAGWETIVRAHPKETIVAVTLHGIVVESWRSKSRARALASLDKVKEHTLTSLADLLDLYIGAMAPNQPSAWSEALVFDLAETRWHYQALTGLHVDFVNTLIMLRSPGGAFYHLGLDPTHEVVTTFPGIDPRFPVPAPLKVANVQSQFATEAERARLLGPWETWVPQGDRLSVGDGA